MSAPEPEDRLPGVLISVMKGVVWRENDPAHWESLEALQARVRDYVALLGLELIFDESEGYAYLRQRPCREGETELPRLVPRRQLPYPVSLLLVLLRRKLAEFDARGGETRLILGRDDIVDLIRVFVADTANEVRLVARVDALIQKVVKLGLLRALKGKEERYEVSRILKALVDAQWLVDFDARLTEYRAHGAGFALAEDREATVDPAAETAVGASSEETA